MAEMPDVGDLSKQLGSVVGGEAAGGGVIDKVASAAGGGSGSSAAGGGGRDLHGAEPARVEGSGGTSMVPDRGSMASLAPGGGDDEGSDAAVAAQATAAAGATVTASYVSMVMAFIAWLQNLIAMIIAAVQAMIAAIIAAVMSIVSAVVGFFTTSIIAIGAGIAAISLGGVGIVLVGAFLLGMAILPQVRDAVTSSSREGAVVEDCRPDTRGALADIAAQPGSPGNAQKLANAQHIYSVYAAWGMPDANVAGLLGNYEHESSIDPTQIETIYSYEQYIYGPRKAEVEKRTNFEVMKLAPSYAQQFPGVRDAVYVGIGIEQWTGEGNTKLRQFAAANGKPWYDLDLQLAFFRSAGNPDGNVEPLFTRTDFTPATMAEHFARVYERPAESALRASLPGRIEAANTYYGMMSGWTKNEALAASLLQMSGAQVTEANTTAMANATAKCQSASEIGTVQAGTVQPGPNGEMVNIPYLIQDTTHMACAPGSTDAGVDTAYYNGAPHQIRLCNIDGMLDSNGRPVQINAVAVQNVLNFLTQMRAAGYNIGFNSSFRTMSKQQQLYASSPGGAAPPGYSNHQGGLALDMNLGGSFSAGDCAGTSQWGACIMPGKPAIWQAAHDIGVQNGMFILYREYWHLEFIPARAESRGITVYKG